MSPRIPRKRNREAPRPTGSKLSKRLDQICRPLNPFPFLSAWRRDDTDAAKLYGSIVAQARLPVFYQGVGVPDTLEGRFVVLSLQLLAVLHRLKAEGPPAHGLAQDLIDRFSADMETVLREIGVDLSVFRKR